MDDDKLKANCARALKNMTSDSTEAIEEGAVAALIAMSLEGKAKNNKVSDDLATPEAVAYSVSPAPRCADESVDVVKFTFVLPKVVIPGGESQTGIAHPEKPVSEDVHEDALFPAEELEGPESEGRAKMAFAKMQVPAESRESFLLKDEDFVVKDGQEEEAEAETETETVQRAESGQYDAYDDNGDVVTLPRLSEPPGGEGQGQGQGQGQSESKSPSPKNSRRTTPNSTPSASPKQAVRKGRKASGSSTSGEAPAPAQSQAPGGKASKRGAAQEAAGGDVRAQASQLGLYK